MCICNFGRYFQSLSYNVIHISTSNIWEHPFFYTMLHQHSVFNFLNLYQSVEGKKGEVLNMLLTFISLIMIENIFMFKNYSYFHFEKLEVYILSHFFRDFFWKDLEICTLFMVLVAITFLICLSFDIIPIGFCHSLHFLKKLL